MTTDLISIIVPVFNIQDEIKTCLKTIQSQTYKNFEVLMIDDNSSDHSPEICKNFEQEDNRFKYFWKENGGISSVRNFGLKKIKGNYISFIDGDDYVKSDFLSFLVNLLKSTQSDIAQCGHYIQYSQTKCIEKDKKHTKVLLNRHSALESLCYNGFYDVTLWNKLFRREVFHNVKFPEGIDYEDTATSYLLVENANKFALDMTSKYFYVQRYNSIANGVKFNDHKFDLIDVGDSMADYISKKYPDLTEATNVKRSLVRLSTISQMVNANYINHSKIKSIRMELLRISKSVLRNKKASLRDKMGIILMKIGFPIYAIVWKVYYNYIRRWAIKGEENAS